MPRIESRPIQPKIPLRDVPVIAFAGAIIAAYYYTAAGAALGALSNTAWKIQVKANAIETIGAPIEGAMLGAYAGWTHPIKFINHIWNQACGRVP